MKKPYIICHMMTSIDGRIDCEMTGQLAGVSDYYETLDELNTPSGVNGRVTAELELALPGKFENAVEAVGKECFSKKEAAEGYEVICDSRGTLLWPNAEHMDKPHLILMSERASKEYLEYLDRQGISYIVAGKDRIDLTKAADILYREFDVKRLSVVGGPTINTAFLEDGLLDEISILIGAGIDARGSMPTLFEGLPDEHPVIHLKLKDVKKFESGAVWLRYLL